MCVCVSVPKQHRKEVCWRDDGNDNGVVVCGRLYYRGACGGGRADFAGPGRRGDSCRTVSRQRPNTLLRPAGLPHQAESGQESKCK